MVAFGPQMRDLFDDPRGSKHRYPDGRIVHRDPNKQFRQSGYTKGNALYRAERLAAAVGASATIHVPEGEKDLDAIEAAGGVATCNAMGAGKWPLADSTPLHGAARVVIIRDKDEAGRRHAQQVYDSLATLTPPAVGIGLCTRIARAARTRYGIETNARACGPKATEARRAEVKHGSVPAISAGGRAQAMSVVDLGDIADYVYLKPFDEDGELRVQLRVVGGTVPLSIAELRELGRYLIAETDTLEADC